MFSYDTIKLIDGTVYKIGGRVVSGEKVERIYFVPDDSSYEIKLSQGYITVPKASVLWVYTSLT